MPVINIMIKNSLNFCSSLHHPVWPYRGEINKLTKVEWLSNLLMLVVVSISIRPYRVKTSSMPSYMFWQQFLTPQWGCRRTVQCYGLPIMNRLLMVRWLAQLLHHTHLHHTPTNIIIWHYICINTTHITNKSITPKTFIY